MIVAREDLIGFYKNQKRGERALQDYPFPFGPSEQLAGIIGDIFGDGHLQGNPKWRIDYTSKSTDELNRFEGEIEKVFGAKGKIRECTTNRYGTTFNYGVNYKAVAIILYLFGAPAGNKVLQPIKIPDWILNNKKFFKRFIQRLFDCEGTVDLWGAIKLEMWKSQENLEEGFEFFQTIKKKLKEYFDIDTTNPFTNARTNMRKDGIGTKPMIIKIKRKDPLAKFFKHIGFENAKKQRKLSLLMMGRRKSPTPWEL